MGIGDPLDLSRGMKRRQELCYTMPFPRGGKTKRMSACFLMRGENSAVVGILKGYSKAAAENVALR